MARKTNGHAVKKARRWSFEEDRRLIQLAASLKSLEAIAGRMNRSPASVAKMARRLGLPLKSQSSSKAKRRTTPTGRPKAARVAATANSSKGARRE
jgi:hypothetical protein